jgi:flagellar basal body-associated protein FliL
MNTYDSSTYEPTSNYASTQNSDMTSTYEPKSKMSSSSVSMSTVMIVLIIVGVLAVGSVGLSVYTLSKDENNGENISKNSEDIAKNLSSINEILNNGTVTVTPT